MSKKILTLDELGPILEQKRAEGKRIVLCHGVFDLLHIGHVRHFEQARKFGDVLVVTLTPDHFVNKGPGRPAFPQGLRAEFIGALQCVDYVAINRWPSAVETIHALRPNVFVKGSEFQNLSDTIGHVSEEGNAVRSIGGEICFTEDITFSSSALLNQFSAVFDDATREFLYQFAQRHDPEDVLRPLRAAQELKVLVVGETIIDEYSYCDVLGKSGKEPVLAGRFHSSDRHGGGVLACANHAANFAAKVDVLTYLGEHGEHEEFVRSCLKPNVTPSFIYKKGSPTVVKKRYVEKYLGQKMFEVYSMNDAHLSDSEEQDFCSRLYDILPAYDVVIVADYGHGLISPRSIGLLGSRSRFLAVNTQTNAGNHGFNMISKYSRADYVCLAQREVALETRARQLSPQAMVRHVSDRLACTNVMMTQGKDGSLFFAAPAQFWHAPALATKIVDRVGAGDAVLCVTTLALVGGAKGEIMPFLGNVVGAEAVAIMGNQRSIERVPLYRHIQCIMKVHQGQSSPSLKAA
jgi:rfaE bifunctional protein nucleotidyltransferase chain/domain